MIVICSKENSCLYNWIYNFFMQKKLLFLLLFSIHSVCGQESKTIKIARTSTPVQIDGIPSEDAWNTADVATDFQQYIPVDSVKSIVRTEVRLLYDDEFLYVMAKCYDPPNMDEKGYVTNSLRRDFMGWGLDNFNVILDPIQAKQNAYFFGVNPWGVQREAFISNGGNNWRDWDLSWDNKWYSEAKMNQDHWAVEMAIPFKTLRYKSGSDAWNINFSRQDSKTFENSVWSRVPVNFPSLSLNYAGKMQWDKPTQDPGVNISIIPYVSGGYSDDFTDNEPRDLPLNVGGDVKYSITPSLNLDLTFIPDFSQVEVDQLQTNLSRFELFFPERRQFFLENSDIFGSFGTSRVRPFFSRRIGIVKNGDETIQSKIAYGARLSGSLDKNWRIGVMNTHTLANTIKIDEDDDEGQSVSKRVEAPAVNHSLVALERRVFSKSALAVLFSNVQNFIQPGDDIEDVNDFERMLAVKYDLRSETNEWIGKLTYQQLFTSDLSKRNENFSFNTFLSYNDRAYRIRANIEHVGENFNPSSGFVPRRGITRGFAGVTYRIFPALEEVNNFEFNIRNPIVLDPNDNFRLIEHQINFNVSAQFRNNGSFGVGAERNFIELQDPFDPSGTDGKEFQSGESFTNAFGFFFFRTNPSAIVSFEGNGGWGTYYRGSSGGASVNTNFRLSYFFNTSIGTEWTRILLPDTYNDASLFLINSRVELTFTRSLFLTSILQFNGQSKYFGANVRLQWRFLPASDFFLVYTDARQQETRLRMNNAGVEESITQFFPQTRSLFFKVSYWLSI